MDIKDKEIMTIVILSKDDIKSIRNGNVLTKGASNGNIVTICSEKSYNIIAEENPKLIISEKVIYISDDDIISMILNDESVIYKSKLLDTTYHIVLDTVYEKILDAIKNIS